MVEKLVIIEQEHKIIVAWADDPEDWVASFERQPGFPALQWAERMVDLFNRGNIDKTMPDYEEAQEITRPSE